MNYPELDMSEIGISRRENGRYFWKVLPIAYPGLSDQVDVVRGWPDDTTERALPLMEDCPKAPNGDVLISAETDRVKKEDQVMIDQAISDGYVTELTSSEYYSLLPKYNYLPS